MKPVNRMVALACCLALGWVSAWAQDYSLSSSDYPVSGTTTVMKTDTTAKAAVNVGSPGKNQTWVFTQNLIGGILPYNYSPAASVYFGESFPTAGWAVQTKQYLDLPATPPVLPNPMVGFYETNYFEKIKSDTVFLIGLSIKTPLYSGGGQLVKPAVNFVFPMEFGKKWLRVSQFNFPISISYGGIAFTTTAAIKDSASVEVDAIGQLTIPSGSYECVRLKQKRFLTILVYVLGSWNAVESKSMIVYQWYTKKAGLLLEVTSHGNETNENFTEAGLVLRTESSSALTGVGCGPGCGSLGGLPDRCTLGQNYPNPFNPSTRIPYQLQTSSNVDIRIYSLLGREIAVLESGLKTAGSQETAWDGRDKAGQACPGSLYFCKMTAVPASGGDPVVQTRKILLTR
jgi:hypothetical protein